MPGPNHHARMSSRPASQRSYGGIDCVASSGSAQSARRCRSARRRRRSGPAARGRPRPSGGAGSPTLTLLASSVARARCSALLTEATLVSSSSATSVAFQRSTSHRISTARWRGGRCCRAATNARRIVSRPTATSAGSPSGATRPSGIGWIHVVSGRMLSVGRSRAPAQAPCPSAARGAHGCSACRGTRWSRCGRATSAARRGPRSGRSCATRG